jgi:hypothetical protein
MSHSVSTGHHGRTVEQELDANIDTLTRWLRENSAVEQPSAGADEGLYERLAWHTGYLIALRDVRELLAAA